MVDPDLQLSWVWLICDSFLLLFSVIVFIYVVGCYKRRDWFLIVIPIFTFLSVALVMKIDIERVANPDESDKIRVI